MVSQNALLFVNTMFGWPMLTSADLPGGGPAYPLSAPGVRLRAHPRNSWTLLVGAFSGSPASQDLGDPQQQNPSGISFPWNGTLAFAEAQYAYPSLGTTVSANQAAALARTYKLGMWYDGKRFADQAIDNTGLSLANPASTGIPRLIDFSLNAGITLHEPFPHRDDDTFGLGMGYAHVSGRAAALDRDTELFTGIFTPARSGETFVEATYQYQATPWLQLQPDFQYVFSPGAGIADPDMPTRRVKDEAVFGLRTTILF
jgi:porin